MRDMKIINLAFMSFDTSWKKGIGMRGFAFNSPGWQFHMYEFTYCVCRHVFNLSVCMCSRMNAHVHTTLPSMSLQQIFDSHEPAVAVMSIQHT